MGVVIHTCSGRQLLFLVVTEYVLGTDYVTFTYHRNDGNPRSVIFQVKYLEGIETFETD